MEKSIESGIETFPILGFLVIVHILVFILTIVRKKNDMTIGRFFLWLFIPLGGVFIK